MDLTSRIPVPRQMRIQLEPVKDPHNNTKNLTSIFQFSIPRLVTNAQISEDQISSLMASAFPKGDWVTLNLTTPSVKEGSELKVDFSERPYFDFSKLPPEIASHLRTRFPEAERTIFSRKLCAAIAIGLALTGLLLIGGTGGTTAWLKGRADLA